MNRILTHLRLGTITALIVAWLAAPACAQTGAALNSRVWEDPATGQLFLRPGHGRVPVPVSALIPTLNSAHEQQVEQRLEAKTAQMLQRDHEEIEKLRTNNAQLQEEVAKIR